MAAAVEQQLWQVAGPNKALESCWRERHFDTEMDGGYRLAVRVLESARWFALYW
jgi:hypothetical protein